MVYQFWESAIASHPRTQDFSRSILSLLSLDLVAYEDLGEPGLTQPSRNGHEINTRVPLDCPG